LFPKVNIGFILILVVFSSTILASIKPQQASAVTVGDVVNGFKTAFGMLALVAAAPEQIKSLSQGVGIAPKDKNTPSASDSDMSKQLQEIKDKLNNVNAQLNILSEKDKQYTLVQMAQIQKEQLDSHPAPEKDAIQNAFQQTAPAVLQDSVRVHQPGDHRIIHQPGDHRIIHQPGDHRIIHQPGDHRIRG
jgi:hypothetical protein